MEQHQKNVDEVIDIIKIELADKIEEAEAKGEMPEEAMLLTKTETVVVWGPKLEREQIRRQWLAMCGKTLPGQQKYELAKGGRCMTVKGFGKGKEMYEIYDHCDITMTPESRQRLLDNARAMAKEEAAKKQEAKNENPSI